VLFYPSQSPLLNTYSMSSAPPPPSQGSYSQIPSSGLPLVDHLDHPIARYRFDDLVARKEIRADMADDLYGCLTASKVVLLLDDSGSMGSRVSDPLSLPYARGGCTTRWSELDMLAHSAIDIITSTNPAGVDTYFLNRPSMMGVTSHEQIAPAFITPPRGGTPIIGALRNIFSVYNSLAASGTRVLIVVITDGEPSDGSTSDLFNLLKYQRHPNIHISLAEMSEDEDTMAFLDTWDRQLVNFDNTDDYRMEQRRVLRNGIRRFTYNVRNFLVKECGLPFEQCFPYYCSSFPHPSLHYTHNYIIRTMLLRSCSAL
jgi:hypothetical protein